MHKLQELKQLTTEIEIDSIKFYSKGNKAAGVRARNNIQLLKIKAQELREHMLGKEGKNKNNGDII